MELTPVVLAVLIAAANAQNDPPFGFTVSGHGPFASIKFWWAEYPCNTSVSYNLDVCKVGSHCVGEWTGIPEYRLSHGPLIPVVFWNHYHVTVSGTCGDNTVQLQEFYADTGPGELLPLENMSVDESQAAVDVTFMKSDPKIQNASESLELVICDIRAEECRDPKIFPITADGYKVTDAAPGVLYSISVRQMKKFEGKDYYSVNLTIPFTHRGVVVEDTGVNYTVSGYGPNAELNLAWDEYECKNGLVTYDVALCSGSLGCFLERAQNDTAHTVRSRPELPIVFWNVYETHILTSCNGTPARQQKLHANTGPGELLPLASLDVVPDTDVVTVTFKTPDWRLQSWNRVVDVTVCDVEATSCLETRTLPLEAESLEVKQLNVGILYNVSASLRMHFENETYTSQEVTRFFTFGEKDDATDIHFNVTGYGPNAEVSLMWDQYPCDKGPLSYNLTFCLHGYKCVEDSTNNETAYVLRTRPGLPVVFWNSYYITIVGVCAGVPVKKQDLYVNTGPGELLPLKRFTVNPEDDAVRISFEIPDNRTQSVAQDVELTICEILANKCLDTKQISITETSYRIGGLGNSVLYNVSARLSMNSKDGPYTSRATTISFVTNSASGKKFPPVQNAFVIGEQIEDVENVTVTLKCEKPTPAQGVTFLGIYVEIYDEDDGVMVNNRAVKGVQLQIRNLVLHKIYRLSVRAMYYEGSNRKESIAQNFVFFTGEGDATKSGFKITPNGPSAEISLWWEAFPCENRQVSYTVTTCLGDTCINHSTQEPNFILKNGFGFPVLLWSSYHVTIEANCTGMLPVKWQELHANTGVGELLPLQMLTAIPDGHAVNISYVKPNKLTQDVADSVEIVFCDVLEPACFEARKIPIAETSHRFDDLKLGVFYNVSARLTKELGGTTYFSQAQSSFFTTAETNETEFPPVANLAVTFEANQTDENVRVKLTYSKPADTGKVFRGIFVELFDDKRNKIKTDFSSETPMELPSLPLFQTFSITVYAVYNEDHDSVRSVGRQLSFFTHVQDVFVPKPEILRLVPVNGTSALIKWTHSSRNSLAFKYRITRIQVSGNASTVVDTVSPQTRTLLLQNFEPDQNYTVNITAYVEANQVYENSSDVQQLHMLPRDALIPTLEVKRLTPAYELELEWTALISPEIQENCTFLALACPDEAACEDRTLTSDLKTVTFDILPYTNYTLRVRTKCDIETGITVAVDSNIVQYNTSEVLAPVRHIHQRPVNLTAVALSWNASSDQNYSGFYVQWTQVGGDGFWTDSETNQPGIILTELQPASAYQVSVKGYKQYGSHVFRSEPTTTKVFSMLPAPDGLWVRAEQVTHTSRVNVSWQGVNSAYGQVEYDMESKCAADEKRCTNVTDIEFKATNIDGYETECQIEVSSCVKSLTGARNCSAPTGATLIVRTLVEPAGAKATYSSDMVYEVAITVPKEYKNLTDLEYQVTEQSGEYGPRWNCQSEAVTKESRYNTEVQRKARLCINDICGQEMQFNITTNVGAPSMVSGLQADVDVTSFAITWTEPEVLNGPLDGYFVTITETRGGETVVSENLKENFLRVKMEKEYTSYDIAVRAYNIDKVNSNVTRSSWASIITIGTDGTEPPPPSKLEELSSRGHSRIEWEVTPSDVFNVTWFRVLASSAVDKPSITFTQYTVFEFSALRPYTVYDFEVSSCMAKDNATCGSPAKLTKRTDVGYPSPPPVMLVGADSNSISVRWTEPNEPFGPIDGYEYAFAAKSSGRTPSNWTSTLPDVRSVDLIGLTPRTEYEVHVRAFNLNSETEPLYSPVGILTASTEGDSNGAVWISVLSVLSVLALCALAYFGYTRYTKKIRDTPLISVGPQTHTSPALEEVDL